MDRTEEEVREQAEWAANWTRRFVEQAQEPVRAELARANRIVAKQEEIIRDLRIKLDSNACVIAAYKAYIAAHGKEARKENPNIIAGRGIREATEEAGPLHLHSTKDEPPAVTIGEVEEWKRRSAEARLSRLDAFLSSKEVPEGLGIALATCGGTSPEDRRWSNAAWRWFREQLG